ncbi:hypothetical protein [Planotetraspora mira]|uniref:Uncharacterized protein n=1 Tax=Planotetraspora mira TaxID=58121 RepID=A0A8J3X8M4_9ACTN|nr:hypothetical protein [Planotetraspora mira]GII32302.1 hypothetical protein Pmi06nite_57440 [Planotetraspora mira]
MSALEVAQHLRSELARHNVPTYLYPLSEALVAVSAWQGLVARTDGQIIWWTSPHPSRRGRALITYAFAPQTAAKRISEHYLQARTEHPYPPSHMAEIRQTDSPDAGHPVMISGPA